MSFFDKLERDWGKFKFEKGKKEDSRSCFFKRIENAKSDVWLLGLGYPNFLNYNQDHPIRHALLRLSNSTKNKIKVNIFVPSNDFLIKLHAMNIYDKALSDLQKSLDYMRKEKTTLVKKNLIFNIYEYQNSQFFGASAIDLSTNESWIHVSQVKKDLLIKDAPYFNFEENEETKEIVKGMKLLFRSIKEKSTLIN